MEKRLNVGELINQFEKKENQSVGTFNTMFKHCRLGEIVGENFVEYPAHWSVEILDMVGANTRRIRLNEKVVILHEMPPISLPNYKRKTDGKAIKVKVDGTEYSSLNEACKDLKINMHFFKKNYIKIGESNEYRKKDY